MTTRRRVAPEPRRRAVLAWPVWCAVALAAPALGGCAGPVTDSGAAGRQAALRARAAADSVTLLGRYDATAAAHPPLAARLAPLRAQVALHAQAFGADGASGSASPSAPSSAAPSAPSPSGSATGSRSASPSPPSSASASPAGPAVPADPGAALKALADTERRTAAARTAAVRDAAPELARLLASVAACGAGHALLLSGGAS